MWNYFDQMTTASNAVNQMLWLQQAQNASAFQQSITGLQNASALQNVSHRWRSINPKKQMTEREARLLIVGGLRP